MFKKLVIFIAFTVFAIVVATGGSTAVVADEESTTTSSVYTVCIDTFENDGISGCFVGGMKPTVEVSSDCTGVTLAFNNYPAGSVLYATADGGGFGQQAVGPITFNGNYTQRFDWLDLAQDQHSFSYRVNDVQSLPSFVYNCATIVEINNSAIVSVSTIVPIDSCFYKNNWYDNFTHVTGTETTGSTRLHTTPCMPVAVNEPIVATSVLELPATGSETNIALTVAAILLLLGFGSIRVSRRI